MQEHNPLILPVETTSIVDAAGLYFDARMVPIPLQGIDANGTCTCKRADCRSAGKHPVGAGWESWIYESKEEAVRRFEFSNNCNIGISLRHSRLVLIDLDGAEGLATGAEWGLPETLTAQSGSGTGAHYIFRLIDDQDGITDRRVAPGLDVKVRGQFVAAPSRHKSGGQYRWTNVMPPAELPAWLYERIRKTDRQPVTQIAIAPSDASTGNLERRARAYAERCEPAIQNSGGSLQTFEVARHLAGFVRAGLTEEAALAILHDYSARCQPPWSERELSHKWADAIKSDKIPVIENRPLSRTSSQIQKREVAPEEIDEADFEAALEGQEKKIGADDLETDDSRIRVADDAGRDAWRNGLITIPAPTKDDPHKVSIPRCLANVKHILQYHPDWVGKLAYDQFRECVTTLDSPWSEFESGGARAGEWRDSDTSRAVMWLERYEKFIVKPSMVEQAAVVVAESHQYHPLQSWLESLPQWDGVRRVEYVFSNYFRGEDSEYVRGVTQCWLVSAIARVYEPGCQCDYMIILEGHTSIGKTRGLECLFSPEWISETGLDLDNKDSIQCLRGKWCHIFDELTGIDKRSVEQVKNFLTRRFDNIRPSYGRRNVDFPRRCVFAATTELSEYLPDPLGNRRFWPVRCGLTGMVDREGISRDRDQIWAEALTLYRAGAARYPGPALDVLCTEQQADRRVTDSWVAKFADWLKHPVHLVPSEFGRAHEEPLDISGGISVGDLLEHAIRVPIERINRSMETRAGACMRAMGGWSKMRVRIGEAREWRYFRSHAE